MGGTGPGYWGLGPLRPAIWLEENQKEGLRGRGSESPLFLGLDGLNSLCVSGCGLSAPSSKGTPFSKTQEDILQNCNS